MIQLKVYLNKEAQSNNRPVFERLQDWNPSLQFPFIKTTEVMRALWGPQVVVSFTIYPD